MHKAADTTVPEPFPDRRAIEELRAAVITIADLLLQETGGEQDALQRHKIIREKKAELRRSVAALRRSL